MTEALKKECTAALLCADIFSVLTSDRIDMLLESAASVHTYKKDELIFSRESRARCIGVLLRGEARVMKDHVTVSVLKRGGQFGTVTLYNRAEGFVNSIIAKTACRVLFLEKPGVDALMAQSRDFAVAYITYLSERIYFLNRKIEAYTAPSAEERLFAHLQSVCGDDGTLCNVNVTELSRQINVSRAGVYRALESLSEEGKLRYAGKTITLTNV